MAGVKGSQPSNLANPVPQGDDPLDALLSGTAAPPIAPTQMPAAQQTQAAPAPEDEALPGFAASVAAPDQVQSAAAVPQDPLDAALKQHQDLQAAGINAADISEPDSVLGIATNLGEQLKNVGTRAKLSFAKTDKEKQQALEDIYGKENVKKVGDEFRYKEAGKWKAADPKSFEVISDIADFARDAMEQGVALPFEAGGTALAATEAISGLGAAAVPATMAASRAGGMAVGMSAADAFAQRVLNIKPDPDRNTLMEQAVGGGMNALLGFAGDKIAASWAARKVARETQRLAPIEERLASTTQGFDESVKTLQDMGLLKPVKGTEVPYTPLMRDPENIYANDITKQVASDAKDAPKLQNIENTLVDNTNIMMKDWKDSIGKAATESSQPARFIKMSDSIKKAEGALIGDFRKQALQEGGNAENPVPEAQKAIGTLSDYLGMKVDGDNVIKPDASSLIAQGKIGIDDERAAEQYLLGPKSLLSNVQKALVESDGRMTFKDLETLRQQASDISDKIRDNDSLSGSFKKMVYGIEQGLRKDSDNTIGMVLNDPGAQAKYLQSKTRYGQIVDAADTIGNTLDNSNMVGTTFGKEIFGASKSGADKVQAWKSILAENPTAWENLKNSYIDDLWHQSFKDKKPNYKSFFSKINSLPKESQLELFGGERGVKAYQALEQYVSRVNENRVTNYGSPENLGGLKKALNLMLPTFIGKKINIGIDILAHMGKGSELARFMTNEGQEEILKGMPQKYRSSAIEFLKNVGKQASLNTPLNQSQLRNKAIIPLVYQGLQKAGVQTPQDVPSEPINY